MTYLYQVETKILSKLDWLPPLLARIVVGSVFIESGWGKLHNIEKVIEFFTSLGIPAPNLQAHFVAGIELVCGALILLGLLTRLASIPLIAIMAVALLTAKQADIQGVTDLFGISEFLYVVLLIWLIVQGAGLLSLDRLLKNLRRS